jgi:hypothetical protein
MVNILELELKSENKDQLLAAFGKTNPALVLLQLMVLVPQVLFPRRRGRVDQKLLLLMMRLGEAQG